MSHELRVKHLLRKKKKGISPLEFPTGFRLSARIRDLREKGWEINTDQTRFLPCKMATYTLISEPENV